MSDFRQDFLRFALEQDVLRFGEFVTKAGRLSPYFFNAGLFNDGASTLALARFYARSILESGVEFDMLFGPAYKGIVLASATAMMLAEQGRNVPFAYNRKEAKDHGEGGTLVGAPLAALAGLSQFPALAGVVPGYGRFTPCPWGLGLEIRGEKAPHWTAPDASARTIGHFGQSGSFVWADRDLGASAAFVGAEPFGQWHHDNWSALNASLLSLARERA